MKYLLLCLLLFYICLSWGKCIDRPQIIYYRYGVLFFNEQMHSRPEIYPVSQVHTFEPGAFEYTPCKDGIPFKNLTAFLSVVRVDKRITATMIINNDSAYLISIPKVMLASNNVLQHEVFFIHSGKIRLDYLGALANYGNHLTYPEDYMDIEPGGVYIEKINLEQEYDFLPGIHVYTISRPNINFRFKANGGWHWAVIHTNDVKISIDGTGLMENLRLTGLIVGNDLFSKKLK